MSSYVVDASVAAKWFLQEPHSEAALRLLADPHKLRAPDLLWLELSSVVCRRIGRKQLPHDEGFLVLSTFRRLPVQLFAATELLGAAADMACDTATSLYDCVYLALAMRLGVPMVTADRRFWRGVSRTALAPHILWVEEIS